MNKIERILFGFCLAPLFIAEPVLAEETGMNRSARTSIGAVSSLDAPPDPDDPGIGGGFEQVSYFRNRFIPKLADCTAQIEAVYRDWASNRDLIIPLHESTAGNVLIHATWDGLNGIFEMSFPANIVGLQRH